MAVVQLRNLTVRYGKFTALNNVSLDLEAGSTGLLGPNGAGKSTMLKTMLGFVKPDNGQGRVFDFDISAQGADLRRKVGYMPEQDCHIPGMTGIEFVSYCGEMSGLPQDEAIKRGHEVLEYCGLGEARYREVETYSTGMKQRVKLGQALVHGPELLLLDEPTNGLDPKGREEMLDLVGNLAKERGMSVLVSSHLLKDIERTCDGVIVLMGGELKAAGTIRDMKQIEGQPVDVELREPNPAFIEAAKEEGLELLEHQLTWHRLKSSGTLDQTSQKVFACARKAEAQVRQLAIAERSLEQAFMEVITREE